MHRFPRIMLGFLIVALALYAAAAGFMWANQRKFMYFPDRAILAPAAYGLEDFKEIVLDAQDRVKLSLWHHAPAEGFPTIVYFHGNGGHLGHRSTYFRLFADAGFGLLGLDYRGYGNSQGTPTEANILEDARTTLRYARETLGLQDKDIALFGESLGTSVAVRMAAEQPVNAVILQSAFTSAHGRAQELYPWLPVRLLMQDTFDSLRYIRNVRAPMLFLHGERDSIIPIAHGRALYEAATAPKHFISYPEINHNDFDGTAVTHAVTRFLHANGSVNPMENLSP